jgi:hypothetical protein
LLHPVSARKILATVDREKMSKLREQYPFRPGSPPINRFEDADYWVPVNVESAQDLWLDRTPPFRILDLGCGAITQWFGVRGFVSCGAVALACLVLVNFAAASPRGKIEVADL